MINAENDDAETEKSGAIHLTTFVNIPRLCLPCPLVVLF